MSRTVLNIKVNELYSARDLRELIEKWCVTHKAKAPKLEHGKINDRIRAAGIRPAWTNEKVGQGYREKFLGRDIAPFVKDFLEEIKSTKRKDKQISIDSLYKESKQKEKAKPDVNQTPQPVMNDDAELSRKHQTSDLIIALELLRNEISELIKVLKE